MGFETCHIQWQLPSHDTKPGQLVALDDIWSPQLSGRKHTLSTTGIDRKYYKVHISTLHISGSLTLGNETLERDVYFTII